MQSKNILIQETTKLARWISKATVEIVEEKGKTKTVGDRQEMQRLNAKFQRESRKDKEKYWIEQCKKLEDVAMRDHTREYFIYVKKTRNLFMARKAMVRRCNGQELQSEKNDRNMQNNFTQTNNKAKP